VHDSPNPLEAWAACDRPRERLRSVGVRHLSVHELVALVVGSGGRQGSVFQVAEGILARAQGSLRRLSALDPAALEAVPGVGAAHAAKVLAAVELGRRAAREETATQSPLRGPADVFRLVGPRLRDLAQEEFHVLLLNTRHCVLREVAATRGILDASLIHPREVFRLAIVEGASGIILVHNHPSGDPTPSAEDRAVTRQLRDAGTAVGIPVLDHVIVGDGRFTSLAESWDR